MKINVSKAVEREANGKTYMLQAVQVDQFPKPTETIWMRPFNMESALPAGLWEADVYVHGWDKTNTATGKTYRQHDIRFQNLRAIA